MASKCFVFISLCTLLLFLTCLGALASCESKHLVSTYENDKGITESKTERSVPGEQSATESGIERLAHHRSKRGRRNRKWRKKNRNRNRKPKTTPKPTNRTILKDVKLSKEDCYNSVEYESEFDQRGYCFLISPLWSDLDYAEDFCNKIKGYRLVTINSKQKQWAVATYVKAHKHEWGYYMSAIDVDPNGDQYWRSTGQTLRYTKWALGGRKAHARDETGPQPCVAINANNRLWYRMRCTYFGRALCEKVMRTKPEPKSTTTTVAPRIRKIYPEIKWAPDDCRSTIKKLWYLSVYYPVGHCFVGSKYTWGFVEENEKFCDKKKGFRLVTINSPEKQKAVAAYVRDHRINENYYISSIDQDDKGEVYWRSTGQTVRYSNWAGKPKTGPQPCVIINRFSFEWQSVKCTFQGPALCEKVFRAKKEKPTPKPTTRKPIRKIIPHRKWSKDDCKVDHSYYLPDGTCLWKNSHQQTQKWATYWCTDQGYQPMTVNSRHRQSALQEYIRWQPGKNEYWISGIDKDDNGELYWLSTGQTVKFTNFAEDVVDKTGPHPCLVLDRNIQMWHDRRCNHRAAVLCERVEEGSKGSQLNPWKIGD